MFLCPHVFAQFESIPGLGHALWFRQFDEMPQSEAVEIVSSFLHEVVAGRTFDRQAILKPFLASAMAQRHVELFEACLQCHQPKDRDAAPLIAWQGP